MSSEDLAKRMIRAFRSIGCFIYEKDLEEEVRALINKTGLYRLVVVSTVDPRYPHIRIVAPNKRDCEARCVSKAQKLIAEGRVVREMANLFMIEYVAQCLRECEREKIKKIISVLETLA